MRPGLLDAPLARGMTTEKPHSNGRLFLRICGSVGQWQNAYGELGTKAGSTRLSNFLMPISGKPEIGAPKNGGRVFVG
jgi:hypothetical protein